MTDHAYLARALQASTAARTRGAGGRDTSRDGVRLLYGAVSPRAARVPLVDITARWQHGPAGSWRGQPRHGAGLAVFHAPGGPSCTDDARILQVPPSVAQHWGQHASNQRLPRLLQARLERAYAVDLGAVQVHLGREPVLLGASALTLDDQLYFDPSAYRPTTAAGEALIRDQVQWVVRGCAAPPRGSLPAAVRSPGVSAVLQRAAAADAPSTKEVNAIVLVLRDQAYPIGSALVPARVAHITNKVAADIYVGGVVVATGLYQNDTHAEMSALSQALAVPHPIANIQQIRVTKGSCHRCAAVLTLLGLQGLVGPRQKSSCAGAYVIPANVQAALAAAFPLLTAAALSNLIWVLKNVDWW